MDQYRISVLEVSTDKLIRRMDKWFDRWEDTYRKDSAAYQSAIQTCASHGRDIETMKEERKEEIGALHKRINHIQGVKTSRTTFWTSIGAAITAVATAVASYFTRGAP